MAKWGPEQDIDLSVQLHTLGPLDPLGGSTIYDITNRVREISVSRGRSDELSHFSAGSCQLVLNNGDRAFDPALTRVVFHGVGLSTATASTPDDSRLTPADLDVRWCGTMDDWSPGGFGAWLVGQWPNVGGNNGWVLGVTADGLPTISWTTNGTTTVTHTPTSWGAMPAGSDQCLRVTVDVNDGAGNRVVRFYNSEDEGLTWSLQATITTAGTSNIFNSTAALQVGGAIAFAGQCRWIDVRTIIDGPRAAYTRFSEQEPGVTSFTDDTGLAWTINGTASIGYDDDASQFAAVLVPLRKLVIVATYEGSPYWLFTGWVDEWPTNWGKTHGTVTVTASDITSVLANFDITGLGFKLDVDKLDRGVLGGDLGQQYTGERVESLLSMAGFGPAQFRVIDRGTTLMSASNYRGDILTACLAAEDAEAGFFFVDATGVIRFRDSASRTENTDMATTQATLRDGDYAASNAFLGLQHVYNQVTFSRSGGDPQLVTDDASIAKYGRRTYDKTVDVLTDGEALGRSAHFVDRFGRPRLRPGTITVKPARDRRAALFHRVMGLGLLDRVMLEQTPLGVGPTMKVVGLVDRVTHQVVKDDWVTTLAISQADIDTSPGYFTLDDPLKGVLGAYPLSY